MKSKMAISFFLAFFVMASVAGAEEWVTFKGHTKTGDELTLKGILEKPQGQGPFPAVVMLHGCGGIEGGKKREETWAQRLAKWGYVSLRVDSFGPRGESDMCSDDRIFLIPPNLRAQDAHDAKSFLAGLPFVKRDQIGVMGFSHGGWTT